MVLIFLILSFFSLIIAGGGLLPEALQVVTLILSFTTIWQMIKGIRMKRLSPSYFIWPILFLLITLLLFLLPLDNLPDWLVSSDRLEIDQLMKEALLVGEETDFLSTSNALSSYSLNWWGTLRFLPVVFLFLNVAYLVGTLSRKQKVTFCYVLVSGGILVATAGMIGEFIYNPMGRLFWFYGDGSKLSHSMACFGNANHYGVFLALFIPFSLRFMSYNYKAQNRGLTFLWGIVYLWLLIGACISLSRGAYILSFFVSVGLLFTGKTGMAKRTVAILLSFTALLIFSWLVPQSLEDEFHQKINEAARLEMYEQVPEVVADFPHGVGPLAYRFISTKYLVDELEMGNIAHHAESTPFQFIQEWGVISFLVWGIVLISFTYAAVSGFLHGNLSRRLAAPAVVALVAALLHSLYDFPYAIPIYSFTVAAICGLLLSRGKEYDLGLHPSWLLYQSWLAILLPLVAVLVIGFTMFNFGGDLYRDRYRYAKNLTKVELASLVKQQPSAWHTWYFLGRAAKIAKKYQFAESCFKNAACYFPNHSNMWYYLAQVRYLQGKKSAASRAFRMFYLLQSSNGRKKQARNARAFMSLSQEEVEMLYYIKLKKSELTKKAVRAI